jgi:hypothetical protein
MPGPYTIRLSIPANTRIQAHTHRDNRSAVVVAGVWYFGYGRVADAAEEKALPAGSFYTEPGGALRGNQGETDPPTLDTSKMPPTLRTGVTAKHTLQHLTIMPATLPIADLSSIA